MNREGFATIIALLVLAGVLVASGVWYYFTYKASVTPSAIQSNQTFSGTASTSTINSLATSTSAIPPISATNQNGNWQINDPKDDFQISIPSIWSLLLNNGSTTGASTASTTENMRSYIYSPRYAIDAGGACGSIDNSMFEQEGLNLLGLSASSSPSILESHGYATTTRVAVNQYGVKMVYTTGGYGCGGAGISLSAQIYHAGAVYEFSVGMPLQESDIPAAYNVPCEDGPDCIGESEYIIDPVENKIVDALMTGTAAPYYQNAYADFHDAMNTLRFLTSDPDPTSWINYQNSEFSLKYPPDWDLVATSGGAMVFSSSSPSLSFAVLSVSSGTDVTYMNLANADANPFTILSIGGPVDVNNATSDFEMIFGNKPFVGKQVVFNGPYNDVDIFDTIVNATSDMILSTFKLGDLSKSDPNAISFTVPPATVSLTVNGSHGPIILATSTAPLALSWQGENVSRCTLNGTYLPDKLWSGQVIFPPTGTTTTALIGIPEANLKTTFGTFVGINCNGWGAAQASDMIQIIIPSAMTSPEPYAVGLGLDPYYQVKVPGKQYTIWWTGGAPTVDVSLWQTTDPTSEGHSVATIAENIPNTEYYTWTVPTAYTGTWFEIQVDSVGVDANGGNFGFSGRFDIATSTSP